MKIELELDISKILDVIKVKAQEEPKENKINFSQKVNVPDYDIKSFNKYFKTLSKPVVDAIFDEINISERQRRIFKSYLVENKKIKEIAEMEHKSISVINTELRFIRDRIVSTGYMEQSKKEVKTEQKEEKPNNIVYVCYHYENDCITLDKVVSSEKKAEIFCSKDEDTHDYLEFNIE